MISFSTNPCFKVGYCYLILKEDITTIDTLTLIFGPSNNTIRFLLSIHQLILISTMLVIFQTERTPKSENNEKTRGLIRLRYTDVLLSNDSTVT